MGYNQKQKEVLDYKFKDKAKNLLVSAAAGSGKTRVLVDKIIDMIINDSVDKTSLSQMLIMTFTIKATYEMKTRIKQKLEEKLKENINNNNLIKETATIQNANITTIDAFCKKIVDENYLELNKEWSLYKNFDPAYKIADEKELSILYDSVLEDFLEKEVYTNKEEYGHFIKSYFLKNSDLYIKNMLLAGIKFLSSLAWPVDVLNKWQNNIEYFNEKAFESLLKDSLNGIDIILDKFVNKKQYIDSIVSMKNIIDSTYSSKSKKKDKDESDRKSKNTLKILEVLINLYDAIKGEEINALYVNEKFLKSDTFKNNFTEVPDNLNLLAKTNIKTADREEYFDCLLLVQELIPIFDYYEKIKTYKELKEYDNNENEKIFLKLLKQFYIRIVEEKVSRGIYAISDYASMTLDILYDDVNGEKVESEFTKNNIKSKYSYIFVDEYQDTNIIQEYLINAISNGKNVFMVGDVKQSIYRFRNSDPSIFTEKFNSYKGNNCNGNLITMDINYRSCYPILRFVNEIFDKIMTKDFGMIDYQNDGRLGLPTKDNSDLKDDILKLKEGKKVEIDLVYPAELEKDKSNATQETDKASNIEIDAEHIARRIEKLHDEGYNYKDIVVIMRTFNSKVSTYVEALTRHNIPCYSELKKGFFNRAEIKLMIDILSVIDNERQDIALTNVLTSNIIGLSNNELALIKLLHLQSTNYYKSSICDDILYTYNYLKFVAAKDIDEELEKENEEKKESIEQEKIKEINKKKKDFKKEEYEENIEKRKTALDEKLGKIKIEVKEFVKIFNEYKLNEHTKLLEKLEKYFKLFNDFRIKARYLGIGELIALIYDKTNIKNIMLAMSDGIMRNANLDVLYETAKGYENSSFVGLFNFMRYIERIKKLNDDQGLAKTSDENDDVVRLMSLHSSKGLEFKCVILANTACKYYDAPLGETEIIQFDSKLGIGLDYYDIDKGYCIETIKKKAIREEQLKQMKEEEMRMLYVALTRAEEKLIITASFAKGNRFYLGYNDIIKSWYNKIIKKEKINVSVKDCESFISLILTNYNIDTESCEIHKVALEYNKKVLKKEDKLTIENIIDNEDEDTKIENKVLSEFKNDESKTSIFRCLDEKKLDRNLSFEYEYDDYKKIEKTKMSVSDIKKEKHDSELFETISKRSAISNAYYSDKDIIIDKTMKNDKNDATEIGNSYHRYMQFFDYKNKVYPNNLGDKVENWANNVSSSKIQSFLQSKIGNEMAKADLDGNLFREQKFMKLFSVDDINEYKKIFNSEQISINKKLSKENNIVIQGIIDAFYIKNDGKDDYIVLVDYKTDGIRNNNINREKLISELKDDYAIQLKIYADALEDLTGLKVKEQYIYSFALDEEIKL